VLTSLVAAIALHKGNVWMELRGWSPRYYSEELKREIGKRLRKKVFFAAYPMLSHERLVQEWQEQGFAPDVLDDVFHGDAYEAHELEGQPGTFMIYERRENRGAR
jgi:uncharacterized protein